MPYLGFFDKMNQADAFVILDNVQFEKNSFLNRNKIKTPNGPIWLTVPTKGHLKQKISEVFIDDSQNWRNNHLKTIFLNYKKSKNFDKIYPQLEKIYSSKERNLSRFNLLTIEMIAKNLRLRPKLYFSSKMHTRFEKSKLLLEIVKKAGGKEYLSGVMGIDYLDEEIFKKTDIKVRFQSYQPRKYPQLWGEFVPNLSAIDYLFCDGRTFRELYGKS